MACVAFVVALLLDLTLWIASLTATVVLVLVFLWRWPVFAAERNPARRQFARTLVPILPWRLLVFVTGLFLVVETISRHGLSEIMAGLIGSDGGLLGMFRAAATGAGLSNLVNNLPAYVAGEAVVPPGDTGQLLALLIGTNVGPLITPWASLATLLWHERCQAFGVEVPIRRFMATGAVLAVTAITAAVLGLALTG